MAWIESHQTIAQHPKTRRSARTLGVTLPAMIGHLHLLWHWALDYAQDGDISAYDAVDIAEAAMWEGDATAFVDALVNCGPGDAAGFLAYDDGRLVIHDWWDYAGKLVARRQADAERKRQSRSAPTSSMEEDERDMSAGCPTDSGETAYVTVPNPTVTQPTNQNRGNVSLSDADAPTAEIGPVFGDDSPEYELAVHLADRKLENNPKSKPTSEKQLQNWANDVRLMVQRDDRSLADIRAVIDWSQSDDFWRANILSMSKLREKYDQLWLKMTTPVAARASPKGGARNGRMNGVDWIRRINGANEHDRPGSNQADRGHRGDFPELPAG